MKTIILALVTLFAAGVAYAQEPTTCAARAAEKKLAGAALKSFTMKCEKDAKGACEVTAKDKKLAGAARTSFVTKCVKDAVGQ